MVAFNMIALFSGAWADYNAEFPAPEVKRMLRNVTETNGAITEGHVTETENETEIAKLEKLKKIADIISGGDDVAAKIAGIILEPSAAKIADEIDEILITVKDDLRLDYIPDYLADLIKKLPKSVEKILPALTTEKNLLADVAKIWNPIFEIPESVEKLTDENHQWSPRTIIKEDGTIVDEGWLLKNSKNSAITVDKTNETPKPKCPVSV